MTAALAGSTRADRIQPHHRLVLDAVLAPEPLLEERYLRWWTAFDPEAPVDAGTYRLLPLLWTRVRELPAAAAFEGRLRGIYRHAWVENQQVLARSRSALVALAEAEVPTMLVKGAALVHHEYPEIGARPMHDLDVLVPYADHDRARTALLEAGWRSRYGAGRVQRIVYGREPLTAPGGGLDLDLHWRAPGDLAADLAGGWLWRDVRPAELLGVPCLRPGPSQHLLITVAHGLRGNLEPPVRWVAEAARILAGADAVEWEPLVAAAAQARLRTRVGAGLALLEEFGVVRVPAEVRTALGRGTAVERWEFRVKATAPQEGNPVSQLLALYWSSRREEPWPAVVGGLPRYATDVARRHAGRARRSLRSRLR